MYMYIMCVCVYMCVHMRMCVCVKGIEHTLMTALNLYLNEFEPHA